MALSQACGDKNLKWVSLLMWVGADPRAKGFAVDDVNDADIANDPETLRSALQEACLWPCNRSLVVLEVMRCLSDARRGKSPDEILRYFMEHRRRRGQRLVSPPAAA